MRDLLVLILYLGREYSYRKEHYKCIETLKKYLEAGTWNAERSDACRLIVMAKMGSEDDAEVTDWCLRAIRECPTQRDSYVLFAQVLFSRKDYAVAYSLIDYAINNTGYNGYQTSGTYWDYNIYSFAARCAYYAGNLKDAIGYGNKAIALNPEDENLKRNMKIYCQEPVSK